MFVISGGKTTEIRNKWPFPSGNMYHWTAPDHRMVQLLREKRHATYEQIVRSQPWVFAGITRLCWWMSRIPMLVETGPADDAEPVTDSGLAKLLLKPNAKMGWRRYMRDMVVWDYMAFGNSVSYKWSPEPGAPVEELWPIPYKFVTEVWDQSEQIIGYRFWLGGESFNITPDQALHTRWPRGIAPLEALARTIGIEDAALEYQASTLRNGITPRASFTTKKSLQDKDLARLREELQKLYAGPDSGGNFAIFDNELQYDKPIGVSAVDLALIQQRELGQEEVAAALDISPPFLGILKRATFNNVEELRDMQFRDSVGPKIDAIAGDIQDQVVDLEPTWEGQRVVCDMEAILAPSPLSQSQQDLMDQQSSTLAIDERRIRRHKKPFRIKGQTDVPLIPANMWPAGVEPIPKVHPAHEPAEGAPPAAVFEEDPTRVALLAEAMKRHNGNGHSSEEDDDDEA